MIHGLILLNKPGHLSSHKAVEKVRQLFKMKKAGHFGTLDPLAEGLLMVGMGNATKFSNFYMKKRKIYSGTITFGYATTTYDAEGDPMTETKEIDLDTVDLSQIVTQFTGKQTQYPPIYSAKKFKGKPLYKYARQNKEEQVEIKPSEIEIFSLQVEIINRRTLKFSTETSSGTYIRSLAHDIGTAVGCGAYLETLSRDGIGEFHLDHAYTFEQLVQMKDNGQITQAVTPIEALLPEYPKVVATYGGGNGVLNGMPLMPSDVVKIMGDEHMEHYRLFDDEGKLLAIARKDEYIKCFKPYIVFNN